MSHAVPQLTARLWRDYPRESAAFALLGVAGIAVLAGAAYSSPSMTGLPGRGPALEAAGPPAPPPLIVRALPPQDAISINKAIPLDNGPNPAARPFSLGMADQASRARALECLTSAIYYEAGSESAEGQRAVAQVVLNRARHPAFPATVCGVVYQGSTRPTGCQFTFTCDGSLARRPSTERWARAREIAWSALNGYVFSPVGTATHYHAEYVVPYWAPTLVKNAVVGAHIFYRWSGGWGRPPAFSQRYARVEPDVQGLRRAAVAAELQEQQQQTTAVVAKVPGAEELPLAPSMRGDKKVAVRFNLVGREAAEAAPREKYVDKVAASETLRWALSGDGVEAQEKPLGAPAAKAAGGAAQAGGAPQ